MGLNLKPLCSWTLKFLEKHFSCLQFRCLIIGESRLPPTGKLWTEAMMLRPGLENKSYGWETLELDHAKGYHQ
jgi:hypothetical protein